MPSTNGGAWCTGVMLPGRTTSCTCSAATPNAASPSRNVAYSPPSTFALVLFSAIVVTP